MMMEHVKIRWMIRPDYLAVMEIEQASFDDPWKLAELMGYMRERNIIGMLAEHEGQIVGYMVYELHEDRIHVLNLTVAPSHRRRGIGRQMVDKVAGKLSPNRRKVIRLETRELNLDAQLFFRAVGFRATDKSVLLNYYANGETAYRFGLPFGAVRGQCVEQTSS